MSLSKIKAAVGVLFFVGLLLPVAGTRGWTLPLQAGAKADKGNQAALADDHKLLRDPDPQVRLKAALVLVEKLDEEAIGVLIDLLAELAPPQRQLAVNALQQVAEEWSPNPALAGDDEISRCILRDAWAAWWRNVDGPALLAAFKKRTLSPEQSAKTLALITDLGDKAFAKREHAKAKLIALGPPVVPLLRQAIPGAELEQSLRLELCIKEIAKTHDGGALPVVAARLLAVRKPAGATAALLAYVPFTEDEVMKWEVAKALKSLAGHNAKVDLILVKALKDDSPVRRAVAGEVLAAVSDADIRAAVRKLLADPVLAVRLRVAVALACAADSKAVPVLIDLVADLPGAERWQAQEILHRLAGAEAPTFETVEDAAAAQKARDAWRAWYVKHSAKIKLVPFPVPPPLLGFTTIAAFSPPPDRTKSRVLEVDRTGKVRWQFECHYPVDVRVLPGNRVLVSECEGLRITERDFKGNILWKKDLPVQPYNIQRLPNGNTFVVGRSRLMEFDAAAKTVFDKNVGEIVAGCKMADGHIVYLTGTGQCIRLDATGNQVKSFASGETSDSGCVLDLTPRGSLLVSRCTSSTAVEFDLHGKNLWQTQGPGAAGVATAVRNGHVMVAVFSQSSVVQVDRTGKVVWQYQTPGYNPFLARQR